MNIKEKQHLDSGGSVKLKDFKGTIITILLIASAIVIYLHFM